MYSAVEALKKKDRQNETQFTTKVDGFLSFTPPWMVMYFFAGFFSISPHVWPSQGSHAVFSLLYGYSIRLQIFLHSAKHQAKQKPEATGCSPILAYSFKSPGTKIFSQLDAHNWTSWHTELDHKSLLFVLRLHTVHASLKEQG